MITPDTIEANNARGLANLQSDYDALGEHLATRH